MAFQPVLIERFKEAWKSETEQYALRTKKAPKPSPGQSEFRWITIGAEAGADGEHHGGHHVMIDSQGVMQTGAFRGKTMGQAFGKKPESQPEKPGNADAHIEAAINQNGGYENNSADAVESIRRSLYKPGEANPSHSDIRAVMQRMKNNQGQRPSNSGIVMPTKTNAEAAPGDQLGLFGDAAKPKSEGPATIGLKPGEATKGRARNLFDTHGDKDQMDLFGDGVMPDELVNKDVKATEAFKPVLLGNQEGEQGQGESPPGPIPFRDRKAFAAKLASEGKMHSEIVDAMVARGVAIVDARRLSAGALGDAADSKSGQFVQSWGELKSNQPAIDGFENNVLSPLRAQVENLDDIKRRMGARYAWEVAAKNGTKVGDAHSGSEGKQRWIEHAKRTGIANAEELANSHPELKELEDRLNKHRGWGNEPEFKPSSASVGGDVKTPMIGEQIDTPSTPAEKASSTFESSIDKGDTPRQAAEAAQKKLDDDYEFARASEVRNAGEDLKGSARHKVNAWRSLDDAEKNGTAAELVTRDQLLRNEPHNLMIHADRNPLTALAMHFAMKAFPGKPGTGRAGDHVKDRKQFLEAYRSVKEKAEDLAKSKEDGFAAIRELQSHVSKLIAQFRGQTSQGAIGISTASDKYNQTANDLVGLTKALQSYGAARSSVKGRLNEFAAAVQEKYGTPLDEIGRSGSSDAKQAVLDMAAEHAKDIIDGKSLNATFGKESKKSNRFDPSEMYVKIAERKGGRDLSKVVSDPNKSTDHMVKEMGLRGVQWGNSVTDEERKHHAAKAVEALTDLADTLGLHPKDITLDSSLGLAIGARGRGGAVAHYEPDSKVINLTRKNGVGSLAHEWAHGFDHYLGNFKSSAKDGPVFMSRRSGYTHTVTSPDGYSSDVDEETANRHLNNRSRFKVAEMKDAPLRKAFQQLASKQSDYRTRLSDHLRALVKEGWMTHEKARDYWQSEPEIFARTFERYVQHKIESSGRKNTYLAGIETKGHKAGGLWPTDDEVKQMAPAFDALFTEYRKQKHGSPDVVKFSRREAERAFMPVFQPVLIARYWGKA